MRSLSLALALALALALPATGAGAVAAPIRSHGMDVHTSCSVNSDYDVSVYNSGIHFSRDAGNPHDVLMHDGHLQIDGHPQSVSPADAARLRQYESHVRTLMPEVAAIARDGVGLGFDALTTVAATFADSSEDRQRITRELASQRRRVLGRIEQGIGSGQWRQRDMDQVMENDMGDAVSTLVSTVASRAAKAALSGDQSQVASLEARAQSLDQSIEQAVEVPAERLGKRADALCPRLVELDQLQHQLEFRRPDGSPLSLMTLKHESPHKNAVADASSD
ncbi:MAG: DUF2884 family protein [Rhodanobacter sp.]